jgi:hypothetical protein
VSESSGSVRLFQNGQIMLHIEPFARPMVWRQFSMEAADNGDQSETPVREQPGEA